jgi:hypothetical protein
VTEEHKKGKLITGVFIDTVNVFTLRDAEYADDEGNTTLTRPITKEDFEAQLAQDLIVPRRLLQARYSLLDARMYCVILMGGALVNGKQDTSWRVPSGAPALDIVFLRRVNANFLRYPLLGLSRHSIYIGCAKRQPTHRAVP